MTINEERVSAISRTHQFLLDLQDPSRTPKVPREIRRQALSLLRHFPHASEAERVWPPQFDAPRYT